MKKIFVFTILLILINVITVKSQNSLLVIANPTSFNKIGSERPEKDYIQKNSDFAYEIRRCKKYWEKRYDKIKYVFWHNTKQSCSYNELICEINSYSELLILDHFSEVEMLGLELNGKNSFENICNSTKTLYLGVCKGLDILEKLNLNDVTIYASKEKWHGDLFIDDTFGLQKIN